MARCNAYLQAGNDTGRTVSVGGRGAADECWAWLNTDNATNSNCALRVRAEVLGPGLRSKDRRKKNSDQRQSVFTVELPNQADEFCEVHIQAKGESMRDLVRMGGLLCCLKAAQDVVNDEPERAIETVQQAAKLIGECEAEAKKNLPRVILPGGVTMAHALACVEVCQRLALHETERAN